VPKPQKKQEETKFGSVFEDLKKLIQEKLDMEERKKNPDKKLLAKLYKDRLMYIDNEAISE
jgi:hypothetical protein